jgi:hypothetical protein
MPYLQQFSREVSTPALGAGVPIANVLASNEMME